MKKAFILITICCISIASWAQLLPNLQPLHGNIDSIQKTYQDDNDWLTTIYFDKNNQAIKQKITCGGILTSEKSFKLDSLQNRILYRTTTLDSINGSKNSFIEREYILDSTKKIININDWSYVVQINNTRLLSKEFSIKYDNNKRVISYKRMSYMHRDTSLQTLFDIKYDEHSRIKEVSTSEIIKDRVSVELFDGSSKVQDELLDSSRIQCKTLYTYNKKGLLKKKEKINYPYNRTKDNMEMNTEIMYYKYDSQNNCIQYLDENKKVLGTNKIFYKK